MFKRNWAAQSVLTLLVVFILVFTSFNNVSGETNVVITTQEDEYCGQVQILLLIDQSTSMLDNDEYRLRNYAPVHLLDVLARNYLLAKQVDNYLYQPKQIDFGIIWFASTATIGMDWTRIAPADYDAWENQRADLINELDPNIGFQSELTDEIGNGTNFSRAFALAEEMFSEQSTPSNGCPERVILVLTDGEPYISGTNMTTADLQGHFSDVGSIINRAFSDEGTNIFVTGINVAGDYYWRKTSDYWSSIVRDSEGIDIKNVEKADTKADIGYRMTEIIRATIGEGIGVVRPGDLVVPPYVEKLILDFYKSDINDLMVLSDDLGKLTPDRTDIEVNMLGEGDAIQTLEVIRPAPGIYHLATTAETDDYRISQVTIFVNTKLTKPEEALQQFTNGEIEILLVDGEGNALPDYENSKYALQLDPLMTYEGEEVPLSLGFDAPSSSIIGSFTPMKSGTYSLSIGAVALDDNNQEITILNQEETKFSILVDPVKVVVGTPYSEKKNCSPIVNDTFIVPLPITNIAKDEVTSISLPLTWTTNADSSLDVSVMGPDSNGEFYLEVFPSKAGSFEIEISATAPDPITAEPTTFFEATIPVVVTASTLYEMENISIEPQMGPISLWIDDLFSSGTEARNVAISRRFFFFDNDIVITTDFANPVNGQPGDLVLLPKISFVNEDTGEVYNSKGWLRDSKGQAVTEITVPEFGNYQMVVDEADTACDVVISIESHPESWRVSPGLSERILVLLAGVALLALIFFGVKFALCRFTNPLRGVIGIVDTKGDWTFWSSIHGRACFTFKPTQPNRSGMVTKIQVSGLFLPKEQFRIKITILSDPVKQKKTTKKSVASLKNWRPMMLGNGFHVDWKPSSHDITH